MGDKGFDIELFFAALADRTRLRLINLMGADELCVCFFVEVLKTNQPKISRHLAYLRRAGLVSDRKDGKYVRQYSKFNLLRRRVGTSGEDWLG